MSLSKLTFLAHLKTLTKPFYHHHHHSLRRSPLFLSLRCLSYATPEEAAAARRERKRRLRIEPPLSGLRNNQQQPPQRRPLTPIQNPNPNAPKLPEHVSALTGKRLELHNKILILIRENDLEEAALLTRHSIYSNCKPTIFTCNSVMAAQLRQGKYSDLLSLHRFITQAGVAANVVTYNLLINAYCDCRKTDTALEHYNQLIKNAPFNPSPTTYRILVKGLVDNSKIDKAIEIKDDMLAKGLAADPIVYNYVMLGLVKEGDGDRALAVYEELKEKLDGFVSDGVVYGNLMKAYFLKGMEKEAMECYADAVGGNTSVRMGAVAYNFMLQALIKNGKFDEALKLFDRIMGEHNPPLKIKVNLGTFNVMADGFCELGRFKEAVEVFRKMGEKRCSADTVSYNNLIEQLCKNGMVSEAEELQREMGEGNKPDEFTYILLVDACFEQDRADDAAGYFAKMVEADLKPNLNSYNKVVDGLIKAGKVVKANEIFSQMIERLKLEAANYEVMVRALCEASKLDELLELVGKMVRDEKVGLSSEMDEVVRDALRKEGREEDLTRVFEEKEREDREKAEALAAEERKAAAKAAEKAAALASFSFSSLIPKKAEPSKASGEANSVNGNTPTDIQARTGEATSANANPAVDVVEEAIEVSAEAASADASLAADVVEEALEVNDLNKESKTSNESVAEQITV